MISRLIFSEVLSLRKGSQVDPQIHELFELLTLFKLCLQQIKVNFSDSTNIIWYLMDKELGLNREINTWLLTCMKQGGKSNIVACYT